MRTRTRARMLAVSLAAGLLLAACAEDGSGSAAEDAAEVAGTPAAGTVVNTRMGAPGTFLTDARGMTLYLFTDDTPGVSNCTGGCLTAWPALLTDGEPVAGAGVDDALLGTTTREDGSVQVTYSGWPLYLFAGDAGPGDLEGQGVNDVWFVISPTGEKLTMGPDVDGSTDPDGYGY